MVQILYCRSYMIKQNRFIDLGVAYLIRQKAESCVLYTESRNGVLLTDCLTLKLLKIEIISKDFISVERNGSSTKLYVFG